MESLGVISGTEGLCLKTLVRNGNSELCCESPPNVRGAKRLKRDESLRMLLRTEESYS